MTAASKPATSTTPKSIIKAHSKALDIAIGKLRRSAKVNLKNEIAYMTQKQYSRLSDPNESMKAEDLFHDIELQINEQTAELTKTAPDRLEADIEALRVASLQSAQEAINALASVRKNPVVKLKIKSDRVTENSN